MNEKKYNFNLREEVFGGTLLNLESGKRYFLDKLELKNILECKKYPNDIISECQCNEINLKFITISDINKNINHFSFADIVYLEVTRSCNLRCTHCLNYSGEELPNQLSFEELKKLIKYFSNMGIQEIRFTGGEPLVYKNIYALIKLATENGIYTSMGTNGTLITETVAKKLKEAGLKKAIISIDGTMEKHNSIRGNGSYQKALDGIDNLEKNGIETRVNSVIMKSNMDDIIILAKEFHKNKKYHMIRRFIESGRGENLTDNTLSQADYHYVRKQLSYELENGSYINGHYLREKTEVISDRIKLPFGVVNGCKAGQRALIITPDGGIHLCGFLAAQGFPPVNNVQNIKSWNECWNEMHKADCLHTLRKKLEVYNKIPDVQPTNCLAYVQNYINRGKL